MESLSNLRPRTQPPSLTPMIDVTFQLIIFLILTASFSDQPAIDINLPEAGTAAVVDVSVPRITISASARIFWAEDELAGIEELGGRLNQFRSKNSSREIQIMADERVNYGDVVRVIDMCRAAGLTELILGMDELSQ